MTITAKVISDSISVSGARITTCELEYPRFIHAEFMTHRVFSRNAASSRAIPVRSAIELIRNNTAAPIHWGKNQPGMSAREECNATVTLAAEFAGFTNPEDSGWNYATTNILREQAWRLARNSAISAASSFDAAGYHKQIVNRLLEPFSHIKVVVTSTEWDNFFNLRCHPDAQPEIQKLAQAIKDAMDGSDPVCLDYGDWHVPYYKDGIWYCAEDSTPIEEALMISASCCAQVSYRKNDATIEKARSIYQRLVDAEPPHMSPFEHQATPVRVMPSEGGQTFEYDIEGWRPGITHVDRFNDAWSNNFRGWIQNRALVDAKRPQAF